MAAETTTTAGAPPAQQPAAPGGAPAAAAPTPAAPGPAAIPPAPGPASGTVEERLARIEAALARIVPASHADAQQRTEDRLDRPASVEEQVRAELERAAREAQTEEDHKAVGELKAEFDKLRETPPKEPVTLRQKLLGWRDD